MSKTLKFQRTVRGWLRAVALLSASAGLVGACFAGPGEKIEFSDTGSSAASTNHISARLGPGLSHLSTSPGTLRRIQDDIFNPLASPMDPLDSMQGLFDSAPKQPNQPEQSPAEARRAHRQNDKRKNWAFANMNVLDGTSSSDPDSDTDKNSISLDGKDNKPDSVIEEFVNGKGGKGATNTQVQTIEWYNSANDGRETSYSAQVAANPNNPHSGNWGQIMNRDFFADEQSGDHSAGDTFGSHSEISAARAAADFSAVTKQRDAFRDILNAPSSSYGSGGSGMFGGRSSAAALFNEPSAASSYAPMRSSLYGSGDAFGSSYTAHAVQSLNPNPAAAPGLMGNSVNSPAAVQQLLDPYAAILKRPGL